jgi:hypothetical protein
MTKIKPTFRRLNLFVNTTLDQGLLKEEVSLYCWPPVWLVWNQLHDNWQFSFLFAKQTNPNQSNRRSMVQWYFPLDRLLQGTQLGWNPALLANVILGWKCINSTFSNQTWKELESSVLPIDRHYSTSKWQLAVWKWETNEENIKDQKSGNCSSKMWDHHRFAVIILQI